MLAYLRLPTSDLCVAIAPYSVAVTGEGAGEAEEGGVVDGAHRCLAPRKRW